MSRYSHLAPILTGISVFTLYLLTLMPGLGGVGDTAKFQYLADVLGLGHPTGYPLYLLISKGFQILLPGRNPAWEANLLSAVFSTATCVVLHLTLRMQGIRNSYCFLAAGMLALTETFWELSVTAEVYALMTLIFSLTTYLLLAWHQSGDRRRLHVAAAIVGISVAHHALNLVFIPVFIVFLLRMEERALRDSRLWAYGVLGLSLGALSYGYFFLRSGETGAPYVEHPVGSLGELWWFISGAKYHGRMFAFGLVEWITERVPLYADILWRQWRYLSIFALAALIRGPLAVRWLCAGALLINFVVITNYNIPDVFHYFLPSSYVLALLLGLGLERWFPRPHRVVQLTLFLVLLAFFNKNLGRSARHHDSHIQEWCSLILNGIQTEAVVAAGSYGDGQYLMYTMLSGDGRDREQPLYVVRPGNADELLGYLSAKHVFRVPGAGPYVPMRLDVYTTSDRWRGELLEGGFELEQLGRKFFAVRKLP